MTKLETQIVDHVCSLVPQIRELMTTKYFTVKEHTFPFVFRGLTCGLHYNVQDRVFEKITYPKYPECIHCCEYDFDIEEINIKDLKL